MNRRHFLRSTTALAFGSTMSVAEERKSEELKNFKITKISHSSEWDDVNNRYASLNWRSGFGFRSQHPGIVQFLFCDGRVTAIKETINRDYVYRALSTRAQGEVVSADSY